MKTGDTIMENMAFKTFSFLMKTLYPAVILITMLTLVTGLLYPSLITGIAQSVFPEKANGNRRAGERNDRRLP